MLLTLALYGAQAQAQAQPRTTSQTWACTAGPFQACSFSNDPGWDEYNNTFNNPAIPPNSYTLYVNSHSNWEVVANQARCPTTDCAVEAFVSAQYNFDNQPGVQELSDIAYMTSTFRETMPTGNMYTNGFDSEAAYDIWCDNNDLEVMIWVDNQGQTPGGQEIATVRLFGQEFIVYHSGSLTDLNSGTYTFVLASNETSGLVNILDVYRWLITNGYISASDYMTQFNFGWEIASTAGQSDTFRLNSLTLNTNLIPPASSSTHPALATHAGPPPASEPPASLMARA